MVMQSGHDMLIHEAIHPDKKQQMNLSTTTMVMKQHEIVLESYDCQCTAVGMRLTG